MSETLYRFWCGESLLYVGISSNAYARMAAHRRGAEWWPEADRVTFERYPDRGTVLAAETRAIREEHPAHNIQHANDQASMHADLPVENKAERLPILTVEQAEERCGVHRQTIANALRAGELHGAQRTTRGTWRIREECLIAWLMVEPCEHQKTLGVAA